MVCIDEVHCSSEWSHNFRPCYLKLDDIIINRLDCSVVLGLTATATKNTEKSLNKAYGFKNTIRSNDLSRMNLSLCITRDEHTTKQDNVCKLIKSGEYKDCKSIIIYCTYKSTTEILSRHLTQQGIESKAYHAGRSDVERQYIQECFNKNMIRCIVCTIAFSMGIDKKDVNSVIHYDMPQSIESYVQEIGRAGRDGKLAKCHLIISDTNYYSLRQILLSNIIDKDVTLKLMSRLMSEIKQVAVDKKTCTHIGHGRKFIDIEDDNADMKVDETNKEIIFDKPKYVFLPVDTITSELDIKKEVALTLFSYLENHYLETDGDFFVRLHSNTHLIVTIRFYTSSAEEVAEESELIKTLIENCNIRDGVYRCSIPVLCYKLNVPPFEIPRILNELQSRDKLTYDLERDTFCLAAYKLKEDIPGIARTLYQRACDIEDNTIRKLNSIYIAARKLSFKNIDYYLRVRAEKQKAIDGKATNVGSFLQNVELELAPEMNNLINTYFLTNDFDNIEKDLAGEMGVEEYLPLVRIDNVRAQTELEYDVRTLLDGAANIESSFKNDDKKSTSTYTSLEVVRILLGVQSSSITLTFFRNNPLWAKYNEHDYKDVISNVKEIYIKYQIEIAQRKMNQNGENPMKRRKLS